MRLHRHTDTLPSVARGGMVAIGNFDGVHRGLQAVIGDAVRRARAAGAPAQVLTFEPHPRRFFKPDTPPFQLTRLRTKARVLAGLGVDDLFVLRFNTEMVGHSAEEFIDRFLVRDLQAKHVVIGYDFVFGKGRRGNPDLLRERLAASSIGITVMAPVTAAEAAAVDADPESSVISSTGVRDALRAGDPAAAARLLGRPFEIESRVQRGDARGRQIGFPTANLWLGDYLRPALGVYAIRATIHDGTEMHRGVANLGLRPTFGGLAEPRLEVHLFDFDGDIYGKRLRVELVQFLRPERKFPDIAALREQIGHDAAAARTVLLAAERRRRGPRPLSESEGDGG
jgi:riboflavin kinase/FMN adenylyltransferase